MVAHSNDTVAYSNDLTLNYRLEWKILTIPTVLELENVFRQFRKGRPRLTLIMSLAFPISVPFPEFHVSLSSRQTVATLPGPCYTGDMPKLTAAQIASLTPDQRRELNESRSPSKQVDKALCPAKVRNGDRKGEGCSWAAGKGTNHEGFGYCSKHGGNTTAGKKAAARAYGRQLILDQKERFGGDRSSPYVQNITAEAALLEEVRRSVAMVRWLEEKIGDWDLDEAKNDLTSGADTGLPRLVEETSKGAPAITDVQAWLLLYREERKHAAQVAKMCIDANISKRMVDIAANQGQAIMTVVQAVLKALDLSEIQLQRVPQVVPQVIRQATWQLETRQHKAADQTKGAHEPAHQITDLPGRTPYRG